MTGDKGESKGKDDKGKASLNITCDWETTVLIWTLDRGLICKIDVSLGDWTYWRSLLQPA